MKLRIKANISNSVRYTQLVETIINAVTIKANSEVVDFNRLEADGWYIDEDLDVGHNSFMLYALPETKMDFYQQRLYYVLRIQRKTFCLEHDETFTINKDDSYKEMYLSNFLPEQLLVSEFMEQSKSILIHLKKFILAIEKTHPRDRDDYDD